MHKNFGEWYRLVSIEPTNEALTKRWLGVDEWSSIIANDDDELLETVRIFRSLEPKSSRERFLTTFLKHDASFAHRNNELEQGLLAGAALIQCILSTSAEDEPRTAVLVGTAVEASRYHVSEARLEELSDEVLSGLRAAARQHRERTGFEPVLLSSKEEDGIKKSLEQVTNSPDHAQLRTQVAGLFQVFFKAITKAENALGKAAHDLRCADEETNILWWQIGRSSRDLGRPWSVLRDSTPLIAAWELGDLTAVALGPEEAAAFLAQAVSDAAGSMEDAELHRYINAVPEAWAKTRAATFDERALDLAPLAFALSCRSKSNSVTWPSFFEANTRLKTSALLAPDAVARQAYVEALLLKTLAKED